MTLCRYILLRYVATLLNDPWHLASGAFARLLVHAARRLTAEASQYRLAYPSRQKVAPIEVSSAMSLSPRPSHAPASHFANAAQA